MASLPVEMREMILAEIHALRPRERNPYSRERPWSCVAVCKEWQAFFEARNFRRLALDAWLDVENFGRYIIRYERRRMLKHIWYRIEANEYTCRCCTRSEGRQPKARNGREFFLIIQNLLKTIGSCGPASEWGLGFTLGLSGHSPSDSKHYFREIGTSSEVYPHPDDEECTSAEYGALRRKTWDYSTDEKHGWNNGERDTSLTPDNFQEYGRRVTASIDQLSFHGSGNKEVSLPAVYVVKELLIRRQFLRRISYVPMEAIMSRLCGLERVAIERCLPAGPVQSAAPHDCQVALLLFRSADSFKRMSLLEDHNHLLHGINPIIPERICVLFGGIVADETHRLEHFSAAFSVDAVEFFHDFYYVRQLWTSPGLEFSGSSAPCCPRSRDGAMKTRDLSPSYPKTSSPGRCTAKKSAKLWLRS